MAHAYRVHFSQYNVAMRHLLRILAALSALVALFCVIFWIRSYFAADVFYRASSWIEQLRLSKHSGWTTSANGRITVGWLTTHSELSSEDSAQSLRDNGFEQTGWAWYRGGNAKMLAAGFTRSGHTVHFGFGYSHETKKKATDSYEEWQAVFPLAVPTAVFAALPAHAAWRFLRRGKKGLCPVCGYDLRASPDQCPECGRLVI